jgi:hypothetical protein
MSRLLFFIDVPNLIVSLFQDDNDGSVAVPAVM